MLTRGALQKTIILGLVIVIAAGLLYFIYRTSRAYLSGPNIVISAPADYASFSTSTVTIKGVALRVQSITLDGRPITIDDKGNFSETILLLPGYNIETIGAEDQFGHAVQKRLELVDLVPAAAVATTTASASTSPSLSATSSSQ